MSGQENKHELADLFKQNWLSFVLAFLGLVLLAVGGVVMVKEGSYQKEEGIIIEEEPQEGQKILVDIQGAVKKPGVYKLPFSSRVADLLKAAGGLSEKADQEWTARNLNQAGKLKDGEKYFIPQKGSAVKGSQESGKININSASLSELDSLPGIGKAYSQKIVDNRSYSRIEELSEKKVIPDSTFEKIKDKISVY